MDPKYTESWIPVKQILNGMIQLDSGEYVLNTKTVESNEEILFFAQNGNYYHYSAGALAINEKVAVEALFNIKSWEHICAFTSLNKKESKPYILFLTKKGIIKKSDLSEYNIKRAGSLKAITLDEGDEIVNVLFTDKERVGILTMGGNFLIIETNDIRSTGRVSKGVKAIKLNEEDYVISARIIPADTKFIASISGSGLIKKTSVNEFTVQGKNTKGAKIQKISDGDWMADFLPLVNETEILVASTRACIKLNIQDVPIFSKGAQGNKSIKLGEKDNIVGIS